MVNKTKLIIFSIILLVTLSYFVNAFGVSSPYWDENPLYLQPGETKEIVMILQNMVGGEDITMIGNLNSGNEIAKITDESLTYEVPLGVSNVPVHLRITMPSNAKPGDEWQVGIEFKTIAPNTGGVSIGGAISKGFKVIVPEKPSVSAEVPKVVQTSAIGFIILVIILVILLVVIKYFYKGKKQKDDE